MKVIPAGNYRVRPFLTHKAQNYSYTFLSGSNPSQVSIDLALAIPTGSVWAFNSASDPRNPSGIYEKPLYASIQHLFYETSPINLGWQPTGNLYVVSLAQTAYGERVQTGTFTLTTATSTASLVDNGSGSLFCNNTQIGNIFSNIGIAVIQQATGSATGSSLSQNGLYLSSGSGVSINFNATHTIYEHSVVVTMDPGEFNYSLNPSLLKTGSVLSDAVKVIDKFASGSLVPYFTTVGLYNSNGELVAVGKVPRAIKRAISSAQSVVIRFDI